MALSAAEQAIIDRFNTATSAVAARIQALIDAGTVDNPDFIASLQGIADGLDAMGKTGAPPVA